MLVASCLVCALALSGTSAADEAALTPVGDGLSELREAFTAAEGKARVVIVVSERSAAAKKAMRGFRVDTLPAVSSADLAVFAVWIPERDGDPEADAAREATRVAEPRLRAFWSDDAAALDPFRASLSRSSGVDPGEMPRSGLFAVYPASARWEKESPSPVFWTHVEKKLKGAHPPLELSALRAAIEAQLTPEPEDVASIPTESRLAGGDADRRYFIHGPIVPESARPKAGHPLLVVLPGGSGTADFRAFVKRIGRSGAGKEWLVAQLVSKKWTESQYSVWPTARSRVSGQRFSTEEFIDSVIEEVVRLRSIDRDRIVVLAWSSSGPAVYAHALGRAGRVPVSRYFVSQSVFHPAVLPALTGAKGKRFFLHHSRTDETCAFVDSERARDQLSPAGATVSLVEYEGGHGWHGDMFGQIRSGLEWLEKK